MIHLLKAIILSKRLHAGILTVITVSYGIAMFTFPIVPAVTLLLFFAGCCLVTLRVIYGFFYNLLAGESDDDTFL